MGADFFNGIGAALIAIMLRSALKLGKATLMWSSSQVLPV
jgi:hypothetical protein